ncbi:MAG: AbrB/MazE/SpoVT family DNA-binding domain-containing protein [Balneolaceae bacterium]|jgi:putative addiction module antidote|nr:AbrB/MazE/SpoVT family DNA-binding domain-containing protein [Balneolaceae bacterium]
METKIRKIGNSLGITLPKQVIEELHLKDGDKLEIETIDKVLQLKQIDSEFEDWAEAYRELNVSYKDVLKELAK